MTGKPVQEGRAIIQERGRMNKRDVNIRDAAREDLPVIVEIYNSTIPGGMVTADTEPVTVENRGKWFQEHIPALRPLWVMDYKNKIIGWLSFQSFYGRPAYNRTAEVSIYIDQDYRREGLGTLFLEKAMDHCPKLEIKILLGFIFRQNEPSLKLFRSNGFKRWGYLPGVAIIGGAERDLIILGKRIC
jgi:L-amino acid N-acyltransferase YncA